MLTQSDNGRPLKKPLAAGPVPQQPTVLSTACFRAAGAQLRATRRKRFFQRPAKICKSYTTGTSQSQGFTLIEVVIVVVIVGILAAVIAPPLMEGTKSWIFVSISKDLGQQSRIAMERVVREIRGTGRKADNTPCISSATASTFTFSGANGDLVNCNSVSFTLSGTQLLRGSAILAENVSSFQITYYTNANVVTSTGSAIRRVSIAMTLSTGGQSVVSDSEVNLRNMRGY
jgi:prepilin-type N-terminal cleavage/methylation domain-containing protein